MADALIRSVFLSAFGFYYPELFFTFHPAGGELVCQYPEVAIQVRAGLEYPASFEQAAVEVVQSVAVESEETFRSSETDFSVLLLENAVDGRGQSLFNGYLGENILFFCRDICRPGQQERQCDGYSFHFSFLSRHTNIEKSAMIF